MNTTTDTSPAPAMPMPAHACRICGKPPADAHTSATRAAHTGHLTRLGWSGMCPAPRQS